MNLQQFVSSSSLEATKRCPQCGEVVLAVPIKCRHCKSDITSASMGAEHAMHPLSLIVLSVLSFEDHNRVVVQTQRDVR